MNRLGMIALLTSLVGCGAAQAPDAPPPTTPTQDVVVTPIVTPEVPDGADLPLDLVHPQADVIAVFDVARAYDHGFEALGRALIDDVLSPELALAKQRCDFDPVKEIDRVIFSGDAPLRDVVVAVTFRQLQPEKAIECLTRVWPEATPTEVVGGGVGLALEGGVVFPAERALLMASPDVLERFLAGGRRRSEPPALRKLELTSGSLISVSAEARALGFFQLDTLHLHLRLDGDDALMDIHIGAPAPIPGAGIDLDPFGPESIDRSIEQLVKELSPLLGTHPAAARIVEAIRGVRMDQESSDQLVLRLRLDDATKLDSLWQQVNRTRRIQDASRQLESMSSSLRAAYEQHPGTIPCRESVSAPAEVPRGAAVRLAPEIWNLPAWRCFSFYGPSVAHHRFNYRVGGGWLGPARGGPTPGPNGVELSAEWDFDGDGKTGLITIVGNIRQHTIAFEPEFRALEP